VLRIRCSCPPVFDDFSIPSSTTNLIGGIDMWHKDSAGNWYMADNSALAVDIGTVDHFTGAISGERISFESSFGLGTESSVYLFSSLAVNH
jgi:hypothetical protein